MKQCLEMNNTRLIAINVMHMFVWCMFKDTLDFQNLSILTYKMPLILAKNVLFMPLGGPSRTKNRLSRIIHLF